MTVLQALIEAKDWDRYVMTEVIHGRATVADRREARSALAVAQIHFYVSLGRFDHAEQVRAQEAEMQACDEEDDLVKEIVGAIGAALQAPHAANDVLEVHIDR